MPGARLALFVVAAIAAGAGAVALAVFLLDDDGRGAATTGPDALTAPVAGATAPRLAGTDAVSGESVSLSDYRGQPVVVTVWASWCRPCARQAGPLARFAEKHQDAAILGIDVQDEAEAAKEFVAAARWTYPSIADPDGRLAARLGLADLPTTYFFTREHRLVATAAGYTPLVELEARFEQAKASS